MNSTKLILGLLSCAAISLSASAEDADPYDLKPNLVVTPSRTAEPLGDSLAAVSVITRDDIDLSLANDLFELLRLEPGVDIVRTGGPGAQTSVFLRGSNSNHVLVLIDGVRVSSANTGAYSWEQLPLNQIERVEIVRGPRGSLYGSDSIGGVIAVFTRSDPDPYARITGGSYGSREFEGGAGFSGEHTRLSINAGIREADGFSAQNPKGFSYHPDDDGFKSLNLGIKGSSEFEHGRWTYSLLAVDNESEFDQGITQARQLISSLGFHGSFSPHWDYDLRAGYSNDELDSDFGFFSSLIESERFELGWQNRFYPAIGGRVGFGVDYYTEQGRSAGSWDEKRHNSGLFAVYDRDLGPWQLEIGGRFDDNSRFGDRFTGQAALGYEINESLQLRASYGTAFRGPNFNEQFSPGFGGLFAGNPELKPESSASGELGLRWRHDGAGVLSAAIFRTDADDLIAFNGPSFQAINIDEARLEGLELEYRRDTEAWQWSVNATFQDTQDRATGLPLLRRPEQKGSATLDRRFANGSWVGMEWFLSGKREDFGGMTLSGYSILSLRAGWAFASAWRLEARLENLADENYEPAFGFNAAGRSGYLSLSWQP